MNCTSPFGYRTRAARKEDFPTLVELGNVCDREAIGVGTQRESMLRSQAARPSFTIEQDTIVVVDRTGAIVGFTYLVSRSPYIDLLTRGFVHPEHRGHGIGTAMLEWAAGRTAERVDEAPPGARVVMGVAVPAGHEPTEQLMREFGMTRVRHFVKMVAGLEEPAPEAIWPEGVELRRYDHDLHERAVFDAFDEAFRDHWGHVDRSAEVGFKEWRQWIRHDDEVDQSLWFIPWEGDEVCGVSLGWPSGNENTDQGYIGILGVRRAWRGKGLGLAMLHHSFRVFRERGKTSAALHADGANLTGAMRLYERAGMSIENVTDAYEIEVRAGRELRVLDADQLG